jgi:hypothetical protein
MHGMQLTCINRRPARLQRCLPAAMCVLQLVLCGQTPEVIADSALFAINFYIEQQRLSGMYLNHQLKQKMAIIQTQCKEKLMQMQHAYQQVRMPVQAHRAFPSLSWQTTCCP